MLKFTFFINTELTGCEVGKNLLKTNEKFRIYRAKMWKIFQKSLFYIKICYVGRCAR